ncbi:hypothetical protein EYF80_016906 [Liparis tanakae]|uniref:Uncharacterized protein n=1 Tax=Liparis tanakae TaxID=230148 RepID=A0A4Z2I5Q9_9TELE|nr:hypothetical protein EYF80_016906 [Liparis tanakae]
MKEEDHVVEESFFSYRNTLCCNKHHSLLLDSDSSVFQLHQMRRLKTPKIFRDSTKRHKGDMLVLDQSKPVSCGVIGKKGVETDFPGRRI